MAPSYPLDSWLDGYKNDCTIAGPLLEGWPLAYYAMTGSPLPPFRTLDDSIAAERTQPTPATAEKFLQAFGCTAQPWVYLFRTALVTVIESIEAVDPDLVQRPLTTDGRVA